MSPPFVSLSKKEPLKPTFYELPAEKVDEAGTPSVISVDADIRSRNIRRQAKKQCRIIVCAVTLLIIVAVAAALIFTLVKFMHGRRSAWQLPGSAGMTTNVSVDKDNQLIHAKHTKKDDESQNYIVVMEILHEYSRHMVAYRALSLNTTSNSTTCYIDRLDETFETGYARWESYEESGRQPQALKVIDHKPIEVEVLKHIGDRHIFGHCESGNSYWVMEIEEEDVTTAMRVVYA